MGAPKLSRDERRLATIRRRRDYGRLWKAFMAEPDMGKRAEIGLQAKFVYDAPDGHFLGKPEVKAISLAPPRPRTATERLVAAFLEGRSEHTLAAYSRDLEQFRDFLGCATTNEATQRLLGEGHGEANALANEYRGSLQKRGLSAATVNRRLSCLRVVVKLARTFGMVPWTLEIPSLKAMAYRDTRGPGRDGFMALLAQMEKRTDIKGVRDMAILRLLYERALRSCEVRRLDLSDVDFKRSTVNILGKGRTAKELVTLAPSTMAALKQWIAVRGSDPGPLFHGLGGQRGANLRITAMGVYRVVRKLGESVGVRARPHGLRHAAITEALDRGQTIRAVQRFARHSTLQTLMIYDDNRQDMGGSVSLAISEPQIATSIATSKPRTRKKAASETR